MTAARRFILAPGVLAQASLPEAILLDARAGRYFAANPVATALLRALLAGADEAAMLATLRQQFEADEEVLRADVLACLDDWVGRGLIVVVPD